MTVRYGIAGATASAIAGSIEAGIRDGRLASGAAVPAVRALAARLRVSPSTVAAAYRTLTGRGLLQADGRRGTRVRHRPPLPTRASATVPAHVRDLANGSPNPALLPSLRAALATIDPQPRSYGERADLPELLRLAAERLAHDGIPADALAVVGGALDGIERALQAHLRPGDRIAIEDPGYPGVIDLVAALGLVPEPVALDDAGMVPDALARALHRRVAACIVTPRAQNPSGAALDAARAGELRRLLKKHPDVLVIEDDHAGPVAGTPASTLCDAERARWVVARSVSKSLGPDLRLAVLSGDAATIARVEGRQLIGAGWVSHVLQRLVASFWADAATSALVARAAAAYTARRAELIAALARHGVAAHGRSGLNVWVPVPEEVPVVRSLLAAGYAVNAGERYRIASGPAIRITITTLDADEVAPLAAAVAASLAPARRTHSP
ncbi:MAG: aminotransferase class I/II-fold pyridoxal phosphate-dependent enzyme [Deltaproteobacteria bacterium]|nr:aminotransferase class I/II-fold pyridoxal phosphate-dependent enzyme [Deltaproteobacteria bacterium]